MKITYVTAVKSSHRHTDELTFTSSLSVSIIFSSQTFKFYASISRKLIILIQKIESYTDLRVWGKT